MRPRAARVLPVLLLAGCSGPQNYMDAAGPGARGLAGLGWLALLSLLAVSVVVWALLFWVSLRRRGSFAEHAPAETGGGQRWIAIGGVAIPVAVLSVLFIGTLQTLSAYPMHRGSSDAPDIRITGHQWWFDAEYLPGGTLQAVSPGDVDRVRKLPPAGDRAHLIVHAPTEVHVPVGRPIEIELVTRDVIHSFWVPKLHGKVDLVPGQANRIRILADRPGVYEGECAEYCGVQHAHMRLQIVAEAPDAFAAWLQRQRQPAAPAAGEMVQAGQRLFEGAACALCHTVRGTAAQGRIGPELTHVGSRARIAGGSLPNTTANLEAWITDAQGLKPGSQMPSLRAFRGAELRAVVAYLQSLQ